MSWDEQLVEDFLLEYRKHECLWNPFHRQFHDCLAKGEALKKVVKNLRLGVGVQDCLRLLKCIREKYVEDQTKNLLKLRSSICQPKWMQIVESMLEKIVCDEECKTSYLAPLRKKSEPTVKVLFRHTIPSKKRKCSTNSKQKRGRKKRKRVGKLERRGRCCNNNNAEKDMDPCRSAQDCSRPQSNWCKQRDDYLDKLSWTQPCAKPIECPGLASHIERVSRIENIGKDTCASTPVYMCPNRATHTHCNQNHGRRRHTDIYPTITESRSCRSPPRPQTCPPPPRKPSPERNPCCPPPPRKPSPERNPCCPSRKPSPERNPCQPPPPPPPPRKPTPERNPCSSAKNKEKKRCSSPVEDKCAIDKKDTCTRDTCPSYSRLKTNDSSKACEIKQTDCSIDRNVRFDRDNCTPRVAARFENGVLEAYSQFKVVFPSQDEQQQSSKKKCCAQKVQTDSTTRECAVGVCSREFLHRKSSISSKCSPRKNDMLCGTDEDFVECNNERNDDPCHDYVLLTPGGKYVPLVRTNEADEDQCTCAKMQKQDCCERQDNCTPVRNCEKQNSTLDDDKCPSTTTKLLLRCLEHMLNLEEQQSMSNTKSSDTCEPCRRSKERRDQLAKNVSSSCLPCLEERLNNNNSSQRGKLTQNFLEILKCAMELDCNNNNRKNEEDDDYDNCDEDNILVASSAPNNSSANDDKCVQREISTRDVAVGNDDDDDDDDECCVVNSKGVQENVASSSKSIQCETRRSRDKQAKRDTVLDNLVRCANWPEYKTARNLSVALKCDDDNDDDKEPNVIKRVPATTLPPSMQQQQQQKDNTLACLREELQRDKEYFDQGKVSYVKCNQVYRSYIVRNPSPNRGYHR